MSKPITKEQSRDQLLGAIKCLASYWGRVGKTPKEAAEGMAFSMLNIFDGTAGTFDCAVDLVLRPHPEDKEFRESEGQDYFVDGQVINEGCHLHDMFYNRGPG